MATLWKCQMIRLSTAQMRKVHSELVHVCSAKKVRAPDSLYCLKAETRTLLLVEDQVGLSDAFGGPPINTPLIQYKVESKSHSSKLWETKPRATRLTWGSVPMC